MKSELNPTEEVEHRTFVEYLSLKNIPHFHVPNETFTKSWSIKRRNTALGVKSGVPDLFVFIHGRTIAIEMKRKKGGVISATQMHWLKTLPEYGIDTFVAKGADEAIAYIEGLTK